MIKFSIAVVLLLSTAQFLVADIVVQSTGRCDPNGNCDITQALISAWKGACSSSTTSKIVVPNGKYLLDQIVFGGPCKSAITMQVYGTFVCARQDPRTFPQRNLGWVSFQRVDGFVLTGNADFNGLGALSWRQQLCMAEPSLCTNIRLDFLTNSYIWGISSTDSKMFHFTVYGSNNLAITNIHITAPGSSPNTDGIHVSRSSNIRIENPVISTGDDCISIGDGTTQLNISNAVCGPGHGISIGSLGRYGDEMPVQGITVTDSHMKGTQNGVRVKTLPGSSVKGLVSNVVFRNIEMDNVQNPVIIDQYYCPGRSCTGSSPSLVQIENVAFDNIHGTSASATAVDISCSPGMRCKELHFGYIDLSLSVAGRSVKSNSICKNAVNPYFYSQQNPTISCI